MGKDKKRYNWKARRVVKTDIDRSEEKKIEVELRESERSRYDDSNALVLPSSKRKTRIKKEPGQPARRILSKKQRKKLEKVVERKNLKANRGAMLEALARVQVPAEELSLMTSIAAMQTKGLKRGRREWTTTTTGDARRGADDPVALDAIAGNKKRRRLLAHTPHTGPVFSDPNVVGLESSSEELSSSDEELEVTETVKETESGDKITSDEAEVEDAEESLGDGKTEVENGCKDKEVKKEDRLNNDSTLREEEVVAEKKADKGFGGEKRSAIYVSVRREKALEEARRKLPILGEEQVIMEAVTENPVVILAGETGSGKTTQVPQFLYEAGYARDGKVIGVTEPRRVAAIAMSKRVGVELSLGEEVVSYLVRFEGNTTPKTAIKFMTDGVLLKEIQSDFLLSGYSAIVVDEAHERSVSTDVVLGLLSRIVPLREKRGRPLKLVVMSATLRTRDFTHNPHLFPTPPPLIKVESRQYPVTVHFNKRTNPDYLKEAYRKVCRIHSRLPDGGILVFLTGQQEVKSLVKKLRESFPLKKKTSGGSEAAALDQEEEEEIGLKEALKRAKKTPLPNIDLDRYATAPVDDAETDLLEEEGGDSSDEDWGEEDDAAGASSATQPIWALPLYSLLPSHKQAEVFKGSPAGTRLCVVSTNVAETSLTIPGVKYVVDCGKVKRKLQDKLTGVTGFVVQWASKAEADQRAGRAGRQSPGHCYRLYSSAVFNDEFPEWSEPEIKRRGVEDLVLNMKSLGIQRVAGFPFPTPPDRVQLEAAERTLTLLEAIEPPPPNKDAWGGKLTELGKSMAVLPVGPRYAKMLCLSEQHDLTEYCLALVAGLSVQELLLAPDAPTRAARKRAAGLGNSLLLGDATVVLRAVLCRAEAAGGLGLREQALTEARKLRNQLANQIALSCPDLALSLTLDPHLRPPDDTQARLLRQIVLSGQVDRVAKLVTGSSGSKKACYETAEMEENVEMNKDSVLAREKPDWVVYQEVYRHNDKMYMRGVTAIEAEWLVVFAPGLCNLSPPLEDPPPDYDRVRGVPRCHVNATFGRRSWPLPPARIEFPRGLERYKWFAVFLLDGSVCPKLAAFTGSLLSTPHTMIKSWAKLQPRTELLLKTLVSREIDSRDKLLDCWKTDTMYMLSAYQKWLPESASNRVASIWPPL